MCDWDNPITEYWLEYYLDKKTGMCSLCGQSGIIHTEGIRSPAGIEVGNKNYCICPNGQSLRMNQNEDTDELKCCPMCGSEARKVNLMFDDEISHHDGAACSNKECGMYQPFHLHDWQSRPIEDALQTALDATKSSRNWNYNKVKELEEKLNAVKEAIKEAQKHYYEDGKEGGYYILKNALAEIEKIK